MKCFFAICGDAHPESGLDRKMSFLLATAKLNQAERFGVGLGETYGKNSNGAARIDLLYTEILTDEIGHVGYCASRCTSAERAAMRRLYPMIGRVLARQTDEILQLVDRDGLFARFDRPFDVDALTAGLSNETYLITQP